LSRSELEKLVGARDIADYLNPRSTPWRRLGLKDEKLTKKRALDLLMEDMNLLKRPLLIKGSTRLFGFKEQEWKKALGL